MCLEYEESHKRTNESDDSKSDSGDSPPKKRKVESLPMQPDISGFERGLIPEVILGTIGLQFFCLSLIEI